MGGGGAEGKIPRDSGMKTLHTSLLYPGSVVRASRTLPGTPRSSLVSLQIYKSLLVLSQHRGPLRGAREIPDSSPVVKGA